MFEITGMIMMNVAIIQSFQSGFNILLNIFNLIYDYCTSGFCEAAAQLL